MLTYGFERLVDVHNAIGNPTPCGDDEANGPPNALAL